MSAGGIKFASGINSGPLRPEHYKVFLLQTCLARPGVWVKTPAPGNDLPGDVVRDAQVLQAPHILAEAGAGSLAPVSEVETVAIVSAFEGANCDSDWLLSTLVTFASYITPSVKQAPSSGQTALPPLQLQPGGGCGMSL